MSRTWHRGGATCASAADAPSASRLSVLAPATRSLPLSPVTCRRHARGYIPPGASPPTTAWHLRHVKIVPHFFLEGSLRGKYRACKRALDGQSPRSQVTPTHHTTCAYTPAAFSLPCLLSRASRGSLPAYSHTRTPGPPNHTGTAESSGPVARWARASRPPPSPPPQRPQRACQRRPRQPPHHCRQVVCNARHD